MPTRALRSTRTMSSRQRRSKKRTLYTAQDGRCATCPTRLAANDLILKHKIHRNSGGDSTLANLHLICHPCNRRGHRTPAA